MGKFDREVEIIAASGLFDREWYQAEYPDVKAVGLDPIEHYLQIGALLQRNPSPKFNSKHYLESNPDVAGTGINPLVHFIAFGRKKEHLPIPFGTGRPANDYPTLSGPELPINRAEHYLATPTSDMHGNTISLFPSPCFGSSSYQQEPVMSGPCLILPFHNESSAGLRADLSVGVHLHLFYTDLIDEFVFFLKHIPVGFSLYVSVINDHDLLTLERRFSTSLPSAQVKVSVNENRGRDIAPFVCAFREELMSHDIIAHIHTKRSPHNRNKADWRRQLLTNLLGSEFSSSANLANIAGKPPCWNCLS